MPCIPGWHQYQIISIIKYQSRDICCTRWLACVPWLHMCREFFIIITYGCMSSLRILTSILKSPHLVTHFFCLAHSAVRILVSTSYKAPGSLSAKKKKERKKERKNSKQARREQVGLLYKLSTQTFQKFRTPPSLLRSAEQYSGPAPRARWRLRFLLWYGCLDGGQLQRVRLQCMSAGCVGNCSHFMWNLYPALIL